jgi:hypothetical protein
MERHTRHVPHYWWWLWDKHNRYLGSTSVSECSDVACKVAWERSKLTCKDGKGKGVAVSSPRLYSGQHARWQAWVVSVELVSITLLAQTVARCGRPLAHHTCDRASAIGPEQRRCTRLILLLSRAVLGCRRAWNLHPPFHHSRNQFTVIPL